MYCIDRKRGNSATYVCLFSDRSPNNISFFISCSLLSCSLLYKVVFFSDAQLTRFTPTPRCRRHTVQYSLYIQHHVGDGLLLILLVVVEQNLLAAHHDVLQAHDRSHEVTSTRGIGRNLSDKRRRLTFLAQPNFLVLFLTGSESQPSSRVSEEGRRRGGVREGRLRRRRSYNWTYRSNV